MCTKLNQTKFRKTKPTLVSLMPGLVHNMENQFSQIHPKININILLIVRNTSPNVFRWGNKTTMSLGSYFILELPWTCKTFLLSISSSTKSQIKRHCYSKPMMCLIINDGRNVMTYLSCSSSQNNLVACQIHFGFDRTDPCVHMGS